MIAKSPIYYVRCFQCTRWKRVKPGDPHLRCICTSDEFDWKNVREHDPETSEATYTDYTRVAVAYTSAPLIHCPWDNWKPARDIS